MNMSDSKLFKPLKIGNIEIKHRISMAPLTRLRASDNHVILPMAAEYYSQRASVPGTLLISEATCISFEHGGNPNTPGIWNQEQINAWQKVTTAVHQKGSFIYAQLWALGRVPDKTYTTANHITVKAPSPLPLDQNHTTPQEMTLADIHQTISTFQHAAQNAMAAGFDGVEIHGANGYLVDQFLQSPTNTRTDCYGGSIPNRSRFALQVAAAVASTIGADKTAFRLSPFSTYQGMKMADPIPQFSDIIARLNGLGLAYLHLVMPRVNGHVVQTEGESAESIDVLLGLWGGVALVAGGFDAVSAGKFVDVEYGGRDVVVVFGRWFISNPDLVYRVKKGIALDGYDRSTFYSVMEERGYTDQLFSREWLAEGASAQA